jgi:RimJ/RimL family protein N-acetyltransferase
MLMYEFLSYRPISEDDAELLLRWRRAPHVARYMLSQVDDDIKKQRDWISRRSDSSDFQHRVICIEGKDVGYCSITVRDQVTRTGELGVYIGERDTPRELSIFNFLGTTNHAFFKMGLDRILNRIVENNPRTLKLQAFNGYRSAGVLPSEIVLNGHALDVHLFGMSKTDWHEFRKKFNYYKDWDGNPT